MEAPPPTEDALDALALALRGPRPADPFDHLAPHMRPQNGRPPITCGERLETAVKEVRAENERYLDKVLAAFEARFREAHATEKTSEDTVAKKTFDLVTEWVANRDKELIDSIHALDGKCRDYYAQREAQVDRRVGALVEKVDEFFQYRADRTARLSLRANDGCSDAWVQHALDELWDQNNAQRAQLTASFNAMGSNFQKQLRAFFKANNLKARSTTEQEEPNTGTTASADDIRWLREQVQRLQQDSAARDVRERAHTDAFGDLFAAVEDVKERLRELQNTVEVTTKRARELEDTVGSMNKRVRELEDELFYEEKPAGPSTGGAAANLRIQCGLDESTLSDDADTPDDSEPGSPGRTITAPSTSKLDAPPPAAELRCQHPGCTHAPFLRPQALQSHMRSHMLRDVPCPKCSRLFCSSGDLKRHLTVSHGQSV